MKDIKFSYYPANIKIPTPLGQVTLEQFVKANKDPNENIKLLFEQIKQSEIVGDMKLKAELKTKLFYFTPCINTDGLGRSYSNITSFTGLCIVEFDHIQFAEELRDWIFDNLSSCVCAYISPSGFGVKCIFRIPVVKTVDEFKDYFNGLSFYFEDFAGFDPSAQNPVLPLFLSYDSRLRFREDATVWSIRGEKLSSVKEGPIDFDIPDNIDINIQTRVLHRIGFLIDRIEDNAHPKLVGISTLVGGWVGANAVAADLALDALLSAIERNEYMSKGTQGYCKTALLMFNKGISMPMEFTN